MLYTLDSKWSNLGLVKSSSPKRAAPRQLTQQPRLATSRRLVEIRRVGSFFGDLYYNKVRLRLRMMSIQREQSKQTRNKPRQMKSGNIIRPPNPASILGLLVMRTIKYNYFT